MSAALGAIFRAELKLLLRNIVVATTAILLPLAIAGMFLVSGAQGDGEADWSYPMSLMLVTVFGMSGCVTASATLCYRRDELYLKRLRSGVVSDATILAGVLAPVVLVTLVQGVLMTVLTGIVTSAVPDPLPMLVVLVLGTVMSVGLGMAVTGFASSGEQAQTLATPVFLGLIGSAVWAGMSLPDIEGVRLVLPGGAVVDLLRVAYDDSRFTELVPGAAVLAAWAAVGVLTARRYFRWEPRS
ncbi:ABC transporter permease [Prauserella muralis]|uniref:ABC transporter n=1 Tax=Prauserella muralis TaxID=588067 RepID=A0A2V4BAM1_9PSEU|nr:ABC transporter permease [Prauserella muralis]PXY32121.1 ABC transporter [Prauserella muralis]TWE24229.1 ABC-2 type transport system permease protein [Prauserella muralis]